MFCNKNFNDLLSQLNINLPKEKPKKTKPVIDYTTLDSIQKYNNLFERYKEFFETSHEDYFLYLDHFSSYAYKNDIKADVKEIIYLHEKNLDFLDPILVISFIESLNKFDYYDDNRIWIILESVLIKGNIVAETDMAMYFVILKSFQYFFAMNETTVSSEDIYEIVEYNIINKLNKSKPINIGQSNVSLIDNYLLFAKNLEGSKELYHSIMEKIIIPNFKVISIYKPEMIVSIYYATILINDHVCDMKKYLKLLDDMEKHNCDNVTNDMLKWCLNKRKLL